MSHMGCANVWKSHCCVLVAAAMLMLVPAVGSATTIALTPAVSTVTQGDTLTLSVDVTGASDLFLFQFGVLFDPLIFSALEPLTGSFLDTSAAFFNSGCPFNLCSAPLGTVTEISGFGPLTNPLATIGTLATLSFTAITSTALTPSFFSLTFGGTGDGLFQLIDDPSGPVFFPLDFTNSGATVTVNASTAPPVVPEPATLLLVGSGLAVAIRKRRRLA